MYKIRLYCIANKIKLTKHQWDADLNVIKIQKVHSSYPTKEGRMFYVRGEKKDLFIHILSDGSVYIQDGYDGGDLSRY